MEDNKPQVAVPLPASSPDEDRLKGIYSSPSGVAIDINAPKAAVPLPDSGVDTFVDTNGRFAAINIDYDPKLTEQIKGIYGQDGATSSQEYEPVRKK